MYLQMELNRAVTKAHIRNSRILCCLNDSPKLFGLVVGCVMGMSEKKNDGPWRGTLVEFFWNKQINQLTIMPCVIVCMTISTQTTFPNNKVVET